MVPGSTRSWLAYVLAGIEPKEELKAKQLEKVIYFAANLVTWVDEDKRDQDIAELEREMVLEKEEIDLVIQDMNFRREASSGEEGVALFNAIRARAPDVPVVLLTA